MRLVMSLMLLLGGAFAADAVMFDGAYLTTAKRGLQQQGRKLGRQMQHLVRAVTPKT